MKLRIYPQIILRIPQFALTSDLITEWEKLKISIHLSSPEFYQIIKDVTAETLTKLPASVFHSVWKYFNRAKYRGTPYGSFAAVGVVSFHAGNHTHKVTIAQEQILHSYPCWSQTKSPATAIKDLNYCTLLFTNSSYYKVGNNIRFLIREGAGFQLAEVEWSDLLNQILQFCKKPVTCLSVMDELNLEGMTLLREMVELQLLSTSMDPNLIGPDYFERLGINSNNKQSEYILAERNIISGSPNHSAFRYINEFVNLLATIAPDPDEDSLKIFKQDFVLKYEQKLVPIMEALDPEIGLGYGAAEELVIDDNFAASFQAKKQSTGQNSNFYALHKMLFNIMERSREKTIKLEEIFSEQDKHNEKKLPNSIGVLCSIADEKIFLEQVYGPTANRLAGRFTLASQEIENMCRDIAALEQAANPDVIFFDISYNAEIDVDNVNRRKQIYSYQLSLLNYDLSAEPLTLDDLYLTVRGQELCLISRTLNKRLVPRLATAYNYTRADLSVFRLLCDLQYQSIKSNFDLKLPFYFPGMDFYPRVEFHNIVVCPAQWRVSFKSLQSFSGGGGTEINVLKNYLNNLGIGKYAIVRTDDRTLCFNTSKDEDIRELLFLIKKFKSFLLEEGFIPHTPIVIDTNEQGYNSQILLTMMHNAEVYKGFNAEYTVAENTSHRVFLPGSEWLYFEIFMHPHRSDYFLTQKLAQFLTLHKKQISHWFFIRYNKDGNHLRLRLRVEKVRDIQPLLSAISQGLQRDFEDGIISDFRLVPYIREMERYGDDRIAQIEKHFSRDSEYVLNLIRHMFSATDKYRLCVDLLMRLGEEFSLSGIMFSQIVDGICNTFAEEHSNGPEEYRRLNQEFKRFRKHTGPTLQQKAKTYFEQFESSLWTLVHECPPERKPKLMVDLIHMHINRLFNDHQRSHEMIIYYFAQKELLLKTKQSFERA